VEEKPVAKIDDETLILADVGSKAVKQIKQAARMLLERQLPADQAEAIAVNRYVDSRLSNLG
jgi:hypothetical protein